MGPSVSCKALETCSVSFRDIIDDLVVKHEQMKKTGHVIGLVFDVDGVLILGSEPIPGAAEILKVLQELHIPFILLTNGGGATEEAFGIQLGQLLGLSFDKRQIVLSHSPYHDLVAEYRNKPILVIGGEGPDIRELAFAYGFTKVLTSSDIFVEYPSIHPFAHATRAKHFKEGQKFDSDLDMGVEAVLVWWSSRFDAALDQQVMSDLAAGRAGRFSKPGCPPKFFCCNPDIVFKSNHPYPRPAQGTMMIMTQALHEATTGQPFPNISWCGKPTPMTFGFGERALLAMNDELNRDNSTSLQVKTAYVIGDNESSDIQGCNCYLSFCGIEWNSVLVETGVYQAETVPMHVPDHIAEDVTAAVAWAFQNESPKNEDD